MSVTDYFIMLMIFWFKIRNILIRQEVRTPFHKSIFGLWDLYSIQFLPLQFLLVCLKKQNLKNDMNYICIYNTKQKIKKSLCSYIFWAALEFSLEDSHLKHLGNQPLQWGMSVIYFWIVVSDLPNKSPAEYTPARASAAAEFLCWYQCSWSLS